MNKKSAISKMPDMVLQTEYRILNSAIENVQCFGAQDVLRRKQIAHELGIRGYKIKETSEVLFCKRK